MAKISAVLDGKNFENIAIPSFGSGYPTNSWDDRWATLQQLSGNSASDKKGLLSRTGEYIKDLFSGNADNAVTGSTDIFGNEIVTATDKDGDTYLMSKPLELVSSPVFAKFKKSTGSDDEIAIETFNNMRLKSYLDEYFPSFGTRVMVYEGGRHSWGGQIPKSSEKYDGAQVQEVLNKIAKDGGYYPKPGSSEAINFAIYQNIMLESGVMSEPLISPNLILDVDGDGIPDIDLDGDGIPDFDRNGDGIIDLSSAANSEGGGILGSLLRALSDLAQ